MKLSWLPLLGALLMAAACSNDFELTETRKDIPVVYGLLSRRDTAHYLRVERAFVDPATSALVLAKRADSLYYPDAVVQLEKTGRLYTLQKVDGAREGYPRQSGIFADAPNFLYKVPASVLPLAGGDKIRLLVKRGTSDKVIAEATTVITADPQLIDYIRYRELNFNRYTGNLNLSWSFDPANASVFDIAMVIWYSESDPANPNQFVTKKTLWQIAGNIAPTSPNATTLSYAVPMVDFYKTLAAAIDATQSRKRIFQYMDLYIYAGNSAFSSFLSAGQANSGITGSEYVPTFSNITNGQGLFASRSFYLLPNITVRSETLDSLRYGIYTKNLNFQ